METTIGRLKRQLALSGCIVEGFTARRLTENWIFASLWGRQSASILSGRLVRTLNPKALNQFSNG